LWSKYDANVGFAFLIKDKTEPAADARKNSAARYNTQGSGHNEYAQTNAKNCRCKVHHKEWEYRQEPHEEQIVKRIVMKSALEPVDLCDDAGG